MIALEHPAALARLPTRSAAVPRARAGHRTHLATRLGAAVLVFSVIASLGGWGLVDYGSAYVLQARANELQARWVQMLAQGIPDADLAPLEQQWTLSGKPALGGVAAMFWLPGGAESLSAWQTETDAIWNRDLARYRADAVAAEFALHQTLGSESLVQRKARLDALAVAATPLDFATLRDDWKVEARLVPVDARIAGMVSAIAAQTAQAKQLGIRDDPAGDWISRAGAYAALTPLDRMARAELLTRGLGAFHGSLQARLDAAAVTAAALQHAAVRTDVAEVYGVDPTGGRARIASDRGRYAGALTVAEFNDIAGDANQVAGAADAQINWLLGQTRLLGGVSFYYQDHPLSCEEASTSMAMTHQGIYVSQDQILAEIGADRSPMYVDSAGRVRWGNPYETFVGNVNGSESNFTGYGTYYPPLVRMAQAHGARIVQYGSMPAATVYARVIAGHPVVAFATWDWAWHPRHDYLSFDGQWIPFIGPSNASHVYVVVGYSPTQVLINDPIRGQYWISHAAFEAGYSDFNEAIVFA